jgi:hypothetical protein
MTMALDPSPALSCGPRTLAAALLRPPTVDRTIRRRRRRAAVRLGRCVLAEIRAAQREREDDGLGKSLERAELLLGAYERAGGAALAARLASELLVVADALDGSVLREVPVAPVVGAGAGLRVRRRLAALRHRRLVAALG